MEEGRDIDLPGEPVTVLRAAADVGRFKVLDAALSDVGLVREVNEDALVRRTADGLWAVADGMGGHQGGAWASSVLAQALETVDLSGDRATAGRRLAGAAAQANARVHREAEALGARIGSTLVALLLDDASFQTWWAGDSRAYRLRDGRLLRLTRDHTLVQERVERGLLHPDEARSHAMAHVLSRAVGAQAELALESAEGDARADDLFLLCSDGLHGVATDQEIAEAAAGHDPEAVCRALMQLCLSRGAPDNVTIVAILCVRPAA